MNTIKNNALSIVFFLASVVLGISDQIYLLPIPPKLAQYWWFVLCLAFLVNSFRINNGKIPQKDLLEALDVMIEHTKPKPDEELTRKPPILPLLLACLILGGCAEYAVRPSIEYRSRGISASVSYDGKSIRPKVVIYDKNQIDKELKGLAK